MKLIYAKANDLKKEDEDVIKINKNENYTYNYYSNISQKTFK